MSLVIPKGYRNVLGSVENTEKAIKAVKDMFQDNLSAQLAQCCCDNRAAIADVKYALALSAVEPAAKQTTVCAHLHCAVALFNGELLEFEITVGHCCTMFV